MSRPTLLPQGGSSTRPSKPRIVVLLSDNHVRPDQERTAIADEVAAVLRAKGFDAGVACLPLGVTVDAVLRD